MNHLLQSICHAKKTLGRKPAILSLGKSRFECSRARKKCSQKGMRTNAWAMRFSNRSRRGIQMDSASQKQANSTTIKSTISCALQVSWIPVVCYAQHVEWSGLPIERALPLACYFAAVLFAAACVMHFMKETLKSDSGHVLDIGAMPHTHSASPCCWRLGNRKATRPLVASRLPLLDARAA